MKKLLKRIWNWSTTPPACPDCGWWLACEKCSEKMDRADAA